MYENIQAIEVVIMEIKTKAMTESNSRKGRTPVIVLANQFGIDIVEHPALLKLTGTGLSSKRNRHGPVEDDGHDIDETDENSRSEITREGDFTQELEPVGAQY